MLRRRDGYRRAADSRNTYHWPHFPTQGIAAT